MSGPIRRAYELRHHFPCCQWVTWLSDRLGALWIRPFGQMFTIGFLQSILRFGLGNRIVWNPQKNNGTRWIAGSVEVKGKKLCAVNFTWRFFFFLLFCSLLSSFSMVRVTQFTLRFAQNIWVFVGSPHCPAQVMRFQLFRLIFKCLH